MCGWWRYITNITSSRLSWTFDAEYFMTAVVFFLYMYYLLSEIIYVFFVTAVN